MRLFRGRPAPLFPTADPDEKMEFSGFKAFIAGREF